MERFNLQDIRDFLYASSLEPKRKARQDLTQLAIRALSPILDKEGASPEKRQQLQEVLLENRGRVQIGEDSVKALHEAGLLQGYFYTSAQIDDSGWRDVTEDPLSGHIVRAAGYYVGIPREELRDHYSGVTMTPINLSATQHLISPNRVDFDFTQWTLGKRF